MSAAVALESVRSSGQHCCERFQIVQIVTCKMNYYILSINGHGRAKNTFPLEVPCEKSLKFGYILL